MSNLNTLEENSSTIMRDKIVELLNANNFCNDTNQRQKFADDLLEIFRSHQSAAVHAIVIADSTQQNFGTITRPEYVPTSTFYGADNGALRMVTQFQDTVKYLRTCIIGW